MTQNEMEQLLQDAERYRALQAQAPPDGSKGQLDQWAQLQVDIQKAHAKLENARLAWLELQRHAPASEEMKACARMLDDALCCGGK